MLLARRLRSGTGETPALAELKNVVDAWDGRFSYASKPLQIDRKSAQIVAKTRVVWAAPELA